MPVERRGLGQKQAVVLGVTFHGALAVAALVGLITRSFLAAVFTGFAEGGVGFWSAAQSCLLATCALAVAVGKRWPASAH